MTPSRGDAGRAARDYPCLDRLVENGAGCALCEKPLRQPLIAVALSGENSLLHPDCAGEIGRALIDGAVVISASRETAWAANIVEAGLTAKEHV